MTWAVCLWLAAAAWAQPQAAQQRATPEDCPEGAERVPTNNPIEPFHCKPLQQNRPSFVPMIPKHKLKISCPPGYDAVQTPGELTRWRCRKSPKSGSADPEIVPVLPSGKPGAQGGESGAKEPAEFKAPKEFLRYTIKSQIQFEYPADWHVVEGWTDEVPTLYIEFDTGRQGKQVSLVISKIARGQPTYEEMDDAIAHEKEYQNAADAGSGSVGTFTAKFTQLTGTSKTAYVLYDQNEYYTLGYSAPEDLFKTFLPVYQRLLKSFKIAKHVTGG